jgi:hypothetical protein
MPNDTPEVAPEIAQDFSREIAMIDSLNKEIDGMKGIIEELLRQKLENNTTINNDNTDNSTNNKYVNIFLEKDSSRNMSDITKFIAGIDYSNDNYHNQLMDYLGNNTVIVTKIYKNGIPDSVL